ncbi:MAG: UDP-N-acetylglucosamine 2-epimerase (hydrolyzing), partial [Pelagibacteraceae bacterium]|nr:UDP-N-acetylglucosamine 2-epimerase (hydrolyzing) [Pelagibacteraceae bacterium]
MIYKLRQNLLNSMRKIFLITERRADYSRFKPILELIQQDIELDYDLVVTGMHLKEEHGSTINEIIKDGFKIFSKFEMFMEVEDSGAAMVRSFGECVKKVTFELDKSNPDIILSGFDIAANFAVTIAGAHMNIPVAHIQGGEVTGTIDESIRHAMSKFAHYHFAANQDAKDRLIKLGEIPQHIFNVGCPSIDAILKVSDNPDILKKYDLGDNFYIVLQHPVTTEIEQSSNQILKTIDAVIESQIEAIIVLPNNDAGFSKIMENIKNSKLKFVETLSIDDYVNLLKRSSGLIGNSSSGIHETATFNIPTINIGTRQQGRLRSNNVIDVNYDKDEIINAINQSKVMKGKDFNK